MTWLNEYEIDDAVKRFADDPVIGPAARYLSDYRDTINKMGDGWAYWAAGTKPASQLCDLIQSARRGGPAPHLDDVIKALSPIKAFATRYKNKTGNVIVLPFLRTKEEWEEYQAIKDRKFIIGMAMQLGLKIECLNEAGEFVIHTGVKLNASSQYAFVK